MAYRWKAPVDTVAGPKVPLLPALIVAAAGLTACGNRVDCSSSGAIDNVTQIASEQKALQWQLAGQLTGNGDGQPLKPTGAFVESDADHNLEAERKSLTERYQAAKDQCLASAADEYRERLDVQQICGGRLTEADLAEKLGDEDDAYNGPQTARLNSAYRAYYAIAQRDVTPIVEQLDAIDGRRQAAAQEFEKKNNAASEANDTKWAEMAKSIKYSLETIVTTAKDAQTGSVACKATLTAEVEGKNASSEISYSIEKSSDGKLVATVYGL